MKNIFKNNLYNTNAFVEYYVSADPEEFRKSAKLFTDIKDNINLFQNNCLLNA